MSLPSLKKMIIVSIANAVMDDGPFNGNKLILLTSLGLIEGMPLNSEGVIEYPTTTGDPAVIGAVIDQLAEDYYKKYEQGILSGNDGYMILKDAALIDASGNTKRKFPYLTVFFDQIIAITHGNT